MTVYELNQAERGRAALAVRSGFILRTCDNLGLVRAIRPLGNQPLGAHRFHSPALTSLDTNAVLNPQVKSHQGREKDHLHNHHISAIYNVAYSLWPKPCTLMIFKNRRQCKWIAYNDHILAARPIIINMAMLHRCSKFFWAHGLPIRLFISRFDLNLTLETMIMHVRCVQHTCNIDVTWVYGVSLIYIYIYTYT